VHTLIEVVRSLDYDLCCDGDYRARTFGPFQPTLDGLRAYVRTSRYEYAVLGITTRSAWRPAWKKWLSAVDNEQVTLQRGGKLFISPDRRCAYYHMENSTGRTRHTGRGLLDSAVAHTELSTCSACIST